MKKLKPFYYTLILLGIILIIGVVGFMVIEKYSLTDAVYMTIITATTVGFGEVHPLSPAGRLFTSVLILLSFGIFAFTATTIFQYIISGVIFNYFKLTKVKKEIDHLNHHVIVVGYGRNGMQAIDELKHHHIPLVLVENRESKIREVEIRNDLPFIYGDPSSDEVLVRAGIKRAKALISVLPTDEENVFVVITARELNPKLTIISRAINFSTIKKLRTAGASNVIMPDKISGQHMANMIAQPNIHEFVYQNLLEKSKDISLNEIPCQNIDQENFKIGWLKKEYRMNVIGLRKTDGSYILNPEEDVTPVKEDILFLLGKDADFDRLMNQKVR